MVLLRTGAVSLGIAFTGFCLTNVALKVLLVPCSIKIYITPVIGDYYKKEICTRIHKIIYDQKPRISAQLLYKQLVLYCPAIKSVAIKQNPDRCVYITVQSMQPIMRIVLSDVRAQEHTTGCYVLTNTHAITPACYFADVYLKQLPCLYVSSCNALNDLEKVLNKQPLLLTQELFDQYIITWHSQQKIVLELKKAPGYSIVTNQALLTSKKKVYAEQLCLQSYKKKRSTRVIDIRFDNYLVCT